MPANKQPVSCSGNRAPVPVSPAPSCCPPSKAGVTAGTVAVTSAIAVTVSAGADAVGSETFADVTASVRVVNRGLISYASGSVTAVAAAASSDDGSPYAGTYIVLDVMGGEFVSSQSTEEVGQGPVATQSSALSFLAVDMAFFDQPLPDISRQDVSTATASGVAGNTATFTASIEAVGENSSVELLTDVIAIEDQLSAVTLSGTAGVSSATEFQTLTGTRGADTITATDQSTIVHGGAGKDMIQGGAAGDWLFGEDGKDDIFAGAGDDAAYGGVGDDRVDGGLGADWLFGGRGDDDLTGGTGNDLLLGAAGNDRQEGGDGNDLLSGGIGDDRLFGGSGSDIFMLGHTTGDGDDSYSGGTGADVFRIIDRFDDDIITDFRISEGDRIVRTDGDWQNIAALNLHNGVDLVIARGARDADDLEITFRWGKQTSNLTLDEFFTLNPGYSAIPRKGVISDSDAHHLLMNIFGDDLGVLSSAESVLFTIGDMISDLG